MKLRCFTDSIIDAMQKYKDYLDQKNEVVQTQQRQPEPVRVLSDVLEVRTIEASSVEFMKVTRILIYSCQARHTMNQFASMILHVWTATKDDTGWTS